MRVTAIPVGAWMAPADIALMTWPSTRTFDGADNWLAVPLKTRTFSNSTAAGAAGSAGWASAAGWADEAAWEVAADSSGRLGCAQAAMVAATDIISSALQTLRNILILRVFESYY
jgi:hypothetical protein